MADINTLIEQFIDQCWQRVRNGVKDTDFIYGSQFQDFIEEMQTVLQCGNLLQDSEMKLLKEMIDSKPLLKLYKHEIAKFLLTVVNYSSMIKFLTERAGLSVFNLKLILSNPSRRAARAGSRPNSGPGARTGGYNSPIKSSISNNVKRDINQDLKTDMFTSLRLKDKQISQRDEHISLMTQENISLKEESHDKLVKIKELERKYADLKSYMESVESKLDSKNGYDNSDNVIVKDLIRQCNDRDRVIEHLRRVCQQYQNESESLKRNPLVENLTKSLQQQEKLINNLKVKLKIDKNENSNIQQFMVKLPFLKQFIMYYKYKDQHQNLGVVFMNVLALILSTTVILTILRVIFLVLLYLLNGPTNSSQYIYDDYRSDWEQDRVGISWWKEIEFIEYFIYNLNDWLDGY